MMDDPRFFGMLNMLIQSIEQLSTEVAKLTKELKACNEPPKSSIEEED